MCLLLLSVLSFAVTGCDDDDDDDVAKDLIELIVNKPVIRIGQNEEAKVNVVVGNGNYTVRSFNTAIATATVSGELITVKSGSQNGATTVEVMDGEGVVANISVNVGVFELEVNEPEVILEVAGEKQLIVSMGNFSSNDELSYEVEDETVVSMVNTDQFRPFYTLTGLKNGHTTVTFTDHKGKQAVVQVTVNPISIDVSNLTPRVGVNNKIMITVEKGNGGYSLTAENEDLTSQIADARADIKLLEEEKIQFQKDKETAERRAEKAETELKKLEDRREFLQPVMDNVSKEIKEYGMIKTFLPEATALERAVTYRDKKIKPLFIEMKNKIGAMAAQVKELTRERDKWKSKFQKKKQEHENTKKELAEVQKDYQKLSGEKEILQGIADRYNRLLRMLGKDMVERLVQDDIRMQAELEAKKQKEQMPKKIGDRIQWARERSEEHNAQIKKNKTKYRGMEL